MSPRIFWWPHCVQHCYLNASNVVVSQSRTAVRYILVASNTWCSWDTGQKWSKILIMGHNQKMKTSSVVVLVFDTLLVLFYSPTKHHWNISNRCWIMFRKRNFDARPFAQADIYQCNNQRFPSENLVNKSDYYNPVWCREWDTEFNCTVTVSVSLYVNICFISSQYERCLCNQWIRHMAHYFLNQ